MWFTDPGERAGSSSAWIKVTKHYFYLTIQSPRGKVEIKVKLTEDSSAVWASCDGCAVGECRPAQLSTSRDGEGMSTDGMDITEGEKRWWIPFLGDFWDRTGEHIRCRCAWRGAGFFPQDCDPEPGVTPGPPGQQSPSESLWEHRMQ